MLGVLHVNALNLCFPARCSLRSWYETVHLPHRHRSPNPSREIKSILPYKYCPNVILLNFSVQMRTGLSNLTGLRAVKKLVFTFRPEANINSTVKKMCLPRQDSIFGTMLLVDQKLSNYDLPLANPVLSHAWLAETSIRMISWTRWKPVDWVSWWKKYLINEPLLCILLHTYGRYLQDHQDE